MKGHSGKKILSMPAKEALTTIELIKRFNYAWEWDQVRQTFQYGIAIRILAPYPGLAG